MSAERGTVIRPKLFFTVIRQQLQDMHAPLKSRPRYFTFCYETTAEKYGPSSSLISAGDHWLPDTADHGSRRLPP